jgi:hypothetical protein
MAINPKALNARLAAIREKLLGAQAAGAEGAADLKGALQDLQDLQDDVALVGELGA